ncbi:hypothetical protein APHAL10511_002318 [Amanita phalloides]|nr:hypothetical protein APHAL10511_002318 [Amanita phalloides]
MAHFNRNVRVFDGRTGTEAAGCWQYGRITVATFYQWIHASIVGPDSMRLFRCASIHDLNRRGIPLDPNSSDVLEIGTYVLLNEGGSFITMGHVIDMPLRREYSYNDTCTPRSTDFTTRVRDRDGRCCFTGREVLGNNFTGFEAAHILPMGQTDDWNRRNLQRFVTDPLAPANDKMNSIQQGFLCLSTEHKLFDDYQIGVNPDDEYRITDFGGSNPNITLDGRQFYVADVEEHFRPSHALLRDHYRQCVLACIKAVTGPAHLRRFDPNIDLGRGGFNLEEGGWWSGREGKEQLEVELAARLHRAIVSRDRTG